MSVLFPALLRYEDVAVLLIRLMLAAVFVSSGLAKVRNPAEHARSIEMSPGFIAFLGVAEIAGGLAVALGVLTQLAAIGLILIMFGAILKKIFAWKTGFWGRDSSGWHYDLMLALMSLLILFTGGGGFVLL